MLSNIDYVQFGKENCTSLLNQSPIFLNYLQSILEYVDEQEVDLLWLSENMLNIDEAYGYLLDFIGIIVGQPRLLANFNVSNYFGFLGAYGAESFGTASQPNVGGYWKGLDSYNKSTARRLNDEEYKRVLKARVIFNNSYCTRNELLQVINLITNNTSCSISIDRHRRMKIKAVDTDGLFSYFFSRLDLEDNILPIAHGVTVEQIQP